MYLLSDDVMYGSLTFWPVALAW